MLIRTCVSFCIAALCVPAATQNEILAKMDQSAGAFNSMSANLRKVQHTEVINDNSEESGTILLKREKGARDLTSLVNFTKPDNRTIALRDKKAEIYYPKMNTVQEYNLARYSDLVDQFMLVGFGTAGKELAANYDIKLVGEENVAGKAAVKLELTPKTAARRQQLKRFDLWVADGGAYPVQQRFVQPSGDYTMFTYSDVKLNAPVSDEALRLKLPKNVKREHPQR
jgi:outer membrane lipoprotein-sorting protein